MSDALKTALARILRPLVRLLIARGVGVPALMDLVRQLYVEQAEVHFRLDNKRLTVSRLSLLTGLQRREIKKQQTHDQLPTKTSMGPVPRVLARWATDPDWRDDTGQPRRLPRRGADASFEHLVASVSRDIHPRSVLDALLSDGHIKLDPQSDTVSLLRHSYLPKDARQKLSYFGLNLGDHAAAAVANINAADTPPFFERAVHFNGLSPQALAEVDALARRLQTDALYQIAARAGQLQAPGGGAPGRIRCGAFIYTESEQPKDTSS